MVESLYQELRRTTPRRFEIDNHLPVDPGKKIHKICRTCVVGDSRTPEHCDPCVDNPDKERLKRIGML